MKVKPEPVFAQATDTEQLQSIFQDYGMDLSGPIQDHVIIKDGETIIGGAKLTQLERDYFFLEVFGVNRNYRQQGYGSLILSQITANPWQYCRELKSRPGVPVSYSIGTLAKGKAKDFYLSHGFLPVDFASIPKPYNRQCTFCPDREECRPVPMVFSKS